MIKATRLFLTGSVQGMFFEQFIKEQADSLTLKGFFRKLEDGRVEIFLEGDHEKLQEMVAICKRGYQHTHIRNVEEREERFQGFKEFKVLRL